MEDCGTRRLKRQSYPRWQKVSSPARADFKSESQTENTKCRAGRGGISILRRTALTSWVKAAVDHLRTPRRCIGKWASCRDQTVLPSLSEISGPLQADPVLGVRKMPVDWALRLLIGRVFLTFWV